MINLLHGDCLELMKTIPDKSIDMVLTDPPYGTTACKWDTVIPMQDYVIYDGVKHTDNEWLAANIENIVDAAIYWRNNVERGIWSELKRIRKDKSPILLFGCEPFSSTLRIGNISEYKYDWVWVKDKATNHLNCKKQPMRKTERISVFYDKQCLYNPQLSLKDITNVRPVNVKKRESSVYGKENSVGNREIPTNMTYPNDLLNFNGKSGKQKNKFHPTQKPVALLEYLIKTYTLENETVLDFTMGSGSTGVACKNLNRKFIGIERDDKYFKIARDRINDLLF